MVQDKHRQQAAKLLAPVLDRPPLLAHGRPALGEAHPLLTRAHTLAERLGEAYRTLTPEPPMACRLTASTAPDAEVRSRAAPDSTERSRQERLRTAVQAACSS
jgi:hypothetical protein